MMEAVRDIDHHLICCADSSRGIIEHTYQKEMIRILLPVGGEALFIKNSCYTLIRRVSDQSIYVMSEHCSELGAFA